MSITPNLPSSPEPPVTVASGGSGSKLLPIIILIVMILGFAGLFYYVQSVETRQEEIRAALQTNLTLQEEALQELNSRLETTATDTAELQGQFAVTRDRLGMTEGELTKARQIAANLAKEQKDAAEQLSSRLGQLQQEQIATKGSVGALSTDVGGVKEEVKSTKDELEATKAKLQGVIGDLGVQSDLVAHNRTELDELKRLGTRDYLEFDLKRNSRQKVGLLQLELKRTDVKKQKYTVNLVVDDRTIEKKDKTVHEPVQFYQEGFVGATEIVVNQILKDRIVGYVSLPKKKDERAPMNKSS
ncbi:MAG: hypothetical protein A3F68_03690 [Acidobacteria bacterium RIFCSPLOWO2_12_FULL_54_10]|nr:MAG: hypothetical protein A3F68_03690 [Acidobacteria bacterium RIFCSPLOWO2_12_FULL_54_10]